MNLKKCYHRGKREQKVREEIKTPSLSTHAGVIHGTYSRCYLRNMGARKGVISAI